MGGAVLLFEVPSRRRYISLFLVCFLALAIITSMSAFAQIGVDNDGPSFTDISITEEEDIIHVNVGIRDLNGWDNIFAVVVTVYGEQGDVISQVNFSQYTSYQSDSLIWQWTETTGEYLNSAESTQEAVPIWPWNPDNTENPIGLNLTFGYEKFAGNSISIVCSDKGAVPLYCEYSGPFSAEYTPPPAFGDNVAIPISLSSAIAVAGAVFMVFRRYKNNQLARAVESSQRGK